MTAGEGVGRLMNVRETGPTRRHRRWPYITGGFAILVVVVGLLTWYSWLPDYRPSLRAGERYGVDVSNHQGEIDWEQVAADDIDFAYIKATEGGDFLDTRFEANWTEAAHAGLDRGAYHFFTLCRPGTEQAENFLAAVPIEAGMLPPAIDLELAGNCADRPNSTWVKDEVDAFLDAVEAATGQTVVLYIGDDFEGHYHIREELDRPVWHRRVLIRPDVEGWWIWQVQGNASIDGIEGGVDLNVMRGEQPSG